MRKCVRGRRAEELFDGWEYHLSAAALSRSQKAAEVSNDPEATFGQLLGCWHSAGWTASKRANTRSGGLTSSRGSHSRGLRKLPILWTWALIESIHVFTPARRSRST